MLTGDSSSTSPTTPSNPPSPRHEGDPPVGGGATNADGTAKAGHGDGTSAMARLGALAADPTASSGGHAGRSGRARRPSRWDRPPEPRDWRWAIGGIGRILISVGVLMFGFVGYQLWGTGIQTAQAQNRLEDEFTDLLETAPVATPPADTTATTAPAAPDDPADDTPDSTPDSTPEPTPDTTPTSTTIPPPALTPPPLGDPLARLTIPSIGLDKIVIAGVRPSDLEDGPGHFPETPLPGQLGNAALAGHRTTHGAPFRRIDDVQVGDDIVVETVAGRFVYVMTGQQIVSPNDYQLVIPTVDPTVATLTLTSCHPEYSTRERIIVTAVLDADRSDVVTLPWTAGAAEPPEPSDVLPGDEPVGADGADGADGATASTLADPSATTDPTPATTTPAGDTGDAAGTTDTTAAAGTDAVDTDDASDPGEELFANNWFSDPDAYPHVGLWGLALIVVALAATALSRRVRRNWVGALAGFVPFVVALYFWFENVNRLLPPNL